MIYFQRESADSITITTFLIEQSNQELLEYIVQVYGFLIPRNTVVSCVEFANLIVAQYGTDNLRNNTVVAFLRSLS